jgi:hypothetical protein
MCDVSHFLHLPNEQQVLLLWPQQTRTTTDSYAMSEGQETVPGNWCGNPECLHHDKPIRKRYKCVHCEQYWHPTVLGCGAADDDDESKVQCPPGVGCQQKQRGVSSCAKKLPPNAKPLPPTATKQPKTTKQSTTTKRPPPVVNPPHKDGKKKSKNVMKQRHLGLYGFDCRFIDANKRIQVKPVEEGAKVPNHQYTCHCLRQFKTAQGLGGHQRSCPYAMSLKADREEREDKGHRTDVFLVGEDNANAVAVKARRKSSNEIKLDQRNVKVLLCGPAPAPPTVDSQMNNRGSSHRESITNEYKLKHVELLEQWIQEQQKNEMPTSVSEYCRQYHSMEFDKWANHLSNWKKKSTLDRIVKAVSDKEYGQLKRIKPPGKKQSPFNDMETKLYKEIQEDRKNNRKISKHRICVKAKRILRQLDKENGTDRLSKFRASNGWFQNFLKCRKIKFRARKSGKQKSTDDNMDDIKNWYAYLRYKVLPHRAGESCPHFTEKWGHFPPEL